MNTPCRRLPGRHLRASNKPGTIHRYRIASGGTLGALPEPSCQKVDYERAERTIRVLTMLGHQTEHQRPPVSVQGARGVRF